jgi:outer membrane protein assembly factor BamB
VPVGEGHSSPIVGGGRVYLHTRLQDRETVSCLDLETGKEVWLQNYPVAYNMNPAAVSHGKGPKSTPVLYNDKLCTLGISGILSCFDAKSGRLRWRKEFSRQFKTTSPYFGTAMSPIADKGLLIAHVGGHDSGALTAFDAESGQVKWSWTGDGPGYASPIIVEIDGVRQVVTQTQQNIVGISSANGELLWQIPFTTEYVQNIVTPVLFKETLILSGIDKGTMAIRLIHRGKKWTTEQVWRNEQVAMYMNSPVLSGHLLFGLSHKRKGQFFCMDARTGDALWTSNGRDGENAAILAAGEIVLALTNDAELIVVNRTAKGFEPI